MSSPSDAEVIGRSLDEPEAFGLIYDRHAATLLRFLGRRAGAKVAEGLVGELFRVAFERRKTFDVSRASALPWLYGIGSNLLLKHRRDEARRLRASARMAADRRRRTPARAPRRSTRACCSRAWPTRSRRCRTASARRSCSSRGRSSRTRAWPRLSSCRSARCARGSTAPARGCANCSSRTGREGKITMKPVDLAKKLRREAAFEPAVLDRGKAALMAAIGQEVQPMRRPTIIPRLPYENVGAALSFLECAFGFREVPAARGVRADGAIDYTMVEFGDG